MKYVLVTGGAGFIGSYICKLFYDKGFIPVTFDNLSLGNKWSVKWGPLEVGELCSENDLQKLFERYKDKNTNVYKIPAGVELDKFNGKLLGLA